MPDTPRIIGDGITLRAYEAGDVDGILAYRNDPATHAGIRSTSAMTRERARRFVEKATPARDDRIMWVIDVDGQYAGSVELTTWKRGWGYGAAKLGYGTHPDHRGRGLATAASRLALDWATAQGVETAVWQAVAGNHASWKVAQRLGFTPYTLVPGLLALPDGLTDGWHAKLRLR